MINVAQWASDLLHALGAPDAGISSRFLAAWAQGENTRARFNPLATTRSVNGGWGLDALAAGESNFNSVGVKDFADYVDGLGSTVASITNGRYNEIVAVLRDERPAVNWSVVGPELDLWGTGGAHVNALFNQNVPAPTWAPPSLLTVSAPPPLPAPAPKREVTMFLIQDQRNNIAATDFIVKRPLGGEQSAAAQQAKRDAGEPVVITKVADAVYDAIPTLG
jgi:hypothetical protein